MGLWDSENEQKGGGRKIIQVGQENLDGINRMDRMNGDKIEMIIWVCGTVGLWDCGTVGLWDCVSKSYTLAASSADARPRDGDESQTFAGASGLCSEKRDDHLGLWDCGTVGLWDCGTVGLLRAFE